MRLENHRAIENHAMCLPFHIIATHGICKKSLKGQSQCNTNS